MKKADFKPIWDEFSLSPVVETVGVNVALPFHIRAVINLDKGEHIVEIDPADAPHIISVRKNGVEETSYSLTDGRFLSIAPSPNDVALLEIERAGDVAYSIFAGEIVPGIRTANTGRLKGIVGNIPFTEPHTYRFGIRAQWNGETADVVKTWVAQPADNQLSWNLETLPEQQINETLVTSRSFYTIGEFKRGQNVEVGIDLYNPDFTPLEVETRPVPEMVVAEDHFNGSLPLGLTITNNPFLISGFIPAEAIAGDYFVELFVDEPYGPTPIILHAKLLGDQFDKGSAVNRLSWVTETDLGTIQEGLPSTFKLKAVNSGGGTVTYKMASGSRPLPIGMTLTPDGEIRGIVPHVDADARIEFSVKASSGPYVTQKRFTFKVLKQFESSRHLTITLPISGYTRRAWQAYGNQIDSTRRFRPNDPNFGAAQPSILLIRGLRARPITTLEYDEPFEMIAGAFKWKEVFQDGKHVYDVIYREFFDPMNKAGGFVPDDADVIPDPVYYPQNVTIQIREGTIRNLRADLALKIGLNSTPDKVHVLGPTGGELLDPWMADGYVSAGIIAYVTAGKGRVVTSNLTYGDIPVGHVVSFDRMRVQEGPYSYYYYLGWDRNEDDDVQFNQPLPPYDFRVDGIPVEDDVAVHPEPKFTWAASEVEVTYTMRFYNGPTLIRTVENWEDQELTYTLAMQAEDANPGHVFVELAAVRDGVESLVLEGSVRLRGGWGFAWGFRWGG